MAQRGIGSSYLYPEVKDAALQIGIRFRKETGVRMKIIETYRSFEDSCKAWGKGRNAEDFENIGISSYSKYARPNDSMVSWLSHPNQSMHYKKLAFDAVVTPDLWQEVTRFLWDARGEYKTLYSQLSDIAIEEGLRSFHASYNQDSFHFELPIVFQPDNIGACQSFAVINAIQKISSSWRRLPKYVCEEGAMMIHWKLKKRHLLQSLENSLKVAKELGYIKGYEEISFTELKNTHYDGIYYRLGKYSGAPNIDITEIVKLTGNEGIVISQKKDYSIPKDRKESVELGKGIQQHAYSLDFVDGKGYHMRNSHSDIPTFTVTDPSVFHQIFLITK